MISRTEKIIYSNVTDLILLSKIKPKTTNESLKPISHFKAIRCCLFIDMFCFRRSDCFLSLFHGFVMSNSSDKYIQANLVSWVFFTEQYQLRLLL